MRTPKQIAASRANGARSKGPVTAQGKRNSSKNSTRHGMFADTLVLETEDPAQFHELLDELLDEHQPSTPTQTMLVETVVAARWRQTRIWGIQKTNFDYDIASVASTSENPAQRAVEALRTNEESIRSHELLLRYEVALDRQISRALLRLQQLQDRKAKRKEESIAPQEPEQSAKGAARTSGPDEELIARHSVLRESRKDAKGAPRTSRPAEAPIAGHSILRDSKKDVCMERTQQPPEKKQPVTVAIANPGSTPAKPGPQANSPDRPEHPRLPVPALLDAKVQIKRSRQ